MLSNAFSPMNLHERIHAFTQLGLEFKAILQGNPQTNAGKVLLERMPTLNLGNGWFSSENIQHRFQGIADNLSQQALSTWLNAYTIPETEPCKTIGVILAGNIPLVGFDDFLAILISGNCFLGKTASDDAYLPQAVAAILTELEPRFTNRIAFNDRLANFDAVIATGSGNSARYFNHYFGKYPHIIRSNRNGIAILDGSETDEELKALGEDIFRYFGLGCRNISKLFVPPNYSFNRFFENIVHMGEELMMNKKYMNNYEYHKTLFLMNNTPLLDNNFVVLKEDSEIASPVGMIFHETYANAENLKARLESLATNIQVVVSHSSAIAACQPFGHAQKPQLADYADGVDTLQFLLNLS
jgi:hypothetical protein